MQYSREVEEMVCVAKGPHHGPAPIPEEGKWLISRFPIRHKRESLCRDCHSRQLKTHKTPIKTLFSPFNLIFIFSKIVYIITHDEYNTKKVQA